MSAPELREVTLHQKDTGATLSYAFPLSAPMILAHVCHRMIQELGFVRFWETTQFRLSRSSR